MVRPRYRDRPNKPRQNATVSSRGLLRDAQGGDQALAHKAGLKVMEPSVSRAERLGSKIVMARLAEEVGVPSVPHAIGRAGSYQKLLALAPWGGGRTRRPPRRHGSS